MDEPQPAPATVPAPQAPDEVIRLVVAPGRAVYLPRGSHPFRAGDVIVGARRDIGHLIASGHATPEA